MVVPYITHHFGHKLQILKKITCRNVLTLARDKGVGATSTPRTP